MPYIMPKTIATALLLWSCFNISNVSLADYENCVLPERDTNEAFRAIEIDLDAPNEVNMGSKYVIKVRVRAKIPGVVYLDPSLDAKISLTASDGSCKYKYGLGIASCLDCSYVPVSSEFVTFATIRIGEQCEEGFFLPARTGIYELRVDYYSSGPISLEGFTIARGSASSPPRRLEVRPPVPQDLAYWKEQLAIAAKTKIADTDAYSYFCNVRDSGAADMLMSLLEQITQSKSIRFWDHSFIMPAISAQGRQSDADDLKRIAGSMTIGSEERTSIEELSEELTNQDACK
ncbi:MAG: hypothetical protein HYV63_02155 [Candidatus Schekmanbacteria bacterium]|nr:hypothetical protein [Candidatus Schekmanbacteria bacterium]